MESFNAWLVMARKLYIHVKQNLRNCRDFRNFRIKAENIFRKLDKELENFSGEGISFHVSLLRSLLNYEIATIFIDLDKVSESEKYFQKSYDFIKNRDAESDCIMLAVNVLHDFGNMWAKRKSKSKCWECFDEALVRFDLFKLSKKPFITKLGDLFLNSDERSAKREDNSVTLMLENYLLFNKTDMENEEFILYRLLNLKKMVGANSYSLLEIAVYSNSLFRHFIRKELFYEARCILCCAHQILSKYEEIHSDFIKSKCGIEWITFEQVKLLTGYNWVRYATKLQEVSFKIIYGFYSKICVDVCFKNDIAQLYELLGKSDIEKYEKLIPSAFACNYETAQTIFLFAIKQIHLCELSDLCQEDMWLKIELSFDNGTFYLLILRFEEDDSRKCKMLKRLLNCRESLLKDVQLGESSESFLKNVQQEKRTKFYRRILYDIGLGYSMTITLKKANLELSPNVFAFFTDPSLNKIHYLEKKAIEFYELFVESLEKDYGHLPMSIPEDERDIALSPYQSLIELYEAHPYSRTENLKKASEYRKYIQNYAEA